MDLRYRNVTAIGLLVVVATLLFFWGFYYLLGSPVLSGGRSVVVALQDGAGLKRGDRVNLQGVQVGSVQGVELVPSRGVSVRIEVDEELRLPADTHAAIRGDVFGVHMVNLIPGDALVTLESGDTIRGVASAELPELVAELSDAARSVLSSADSLLSPAALADVHATASVLPASAAELRAAFVQLRLTAESLRRSAEGIEGAEPGAAFTQALAELEAGARAFSDAAVAMEASLGSLGSVLAKIDGGNGTLGRLVNDSTLYVDLQYAAREMGALAADIRARPERYISIEVF